MKTIDVAAHANTKEIDDKLKAILEKGKAIQFTNKLNGIVKIVTEWNIDEMGDLTAEYSTGTTEFVCPYAKEYEITEIDMPL